MPIDTTVPRNPSMVTMSPTLNSFSNTINSPATTSEIRLCMPKPTISVITPRARDKRGRVYTPNGEHGYNNNHRDDNSNHVVDEPRNRDLPLIFTKRFIDYKQRDRRDNKNNRHYAHGLYQLWHEREQAVDNPESEIPLLKILSAGKI